MRFTLSRAMDIKQSDELHVRGEPERGLVAELQRELHKAGYWRGRIDGNFDDSVEVAVRNFQEDAGLDASKQDGRAGPVTGMMLGRFVAQMQQEVGDDLAQEIEDIELENIATKKKIITRLEAQLKLMLSLDQELEYTEALYTWRLRLAKELADRAEKVAQGKAPTPTAEAPVKDCVNVDLTASDLDRAKAMYKVICKAVDDLDTDRTPRDRKNTKKFLLAVAWHESRKCRTRVQDNNGPARSFFQIEAHRAKDCIKYAQARGWLDEVAAACGTTEKALSDAADALPDYDAGDPNASARFPTPNAIEECLRTHDLFGAYLTRICFRKVPAPIPTNAAGQGSYWYEHWKAAGGDRDALIARWIQACREVTRLLGL